MYVKRHTVHKGDREYVYLRLVEAYRNEQGQVRHRLLHTLGREDELKTSGQLDQLAASFARLDPPPTGTRRDFGPLLLVAHYLRRLGLISLVDETAPTGVWRDFRVFPGRCHRAEKVFPLRVR